MLRIVVHKRWQRNKFGLKLKQKRPIQTTIIDETLVHYRQNHVRYLSYNEIYAIIFLHIEILTHSKNMTFETKYPINFIAFWITQRLKLVI